MFDPGIQKLWLKKNLCTFFFKLPSPARCVLFLVTLKRKRLGNGLMRNILKISRKLRKDLLSWDYNLTELLPL